LIQCLSAVGLAILAMLVVRRGLSRKELDLYQDAVGLHFLTVGTIYAVILAFMLATVWQKYEEVATMSEREASYLMDVYRLAQPLPEPDSSRIRAAASQYASDVIEQEWPLMARHAIEFGHSGTENNLWKAVQDAQPTTKHDELLISELLSRYTEMASCRRIRLFHSTQGMPWLLWVILALGAIFTVGLSLLIKIRSVQMHSLLIGLLSLVITLVLLVTQDLSTPFDGVMALEPYGFRQSLIKMDRLSEQTERETQGNLNTEAGKQ
jgi:hypothetical protein